jgi:hypothetical protein
MYMKFKRTLIGAVSVLALGLGAPAAQAGGSGDFYYSRTSPTVCGFYGQATNYDNGSGQTYHWAFKSVDSGYTPNGVVFKVSGTTVKTSGGLGVYEGYTSFSNRSDHSLSFYVKNGSGSCYAIISASAWS